MHAIKLLENAGMTNGNWKIPTCNYDFFKQAVLKGNPKINSYLPHLQVKLSIRSAPNSKFFIECQLYSITAN